MKKIILLIIIYLAFISLGLPDTLLGISWPSMRLSMGLPLEAAGVFAMTITLGTVISSFLSGHILSKLGTGRVVFASCVLTGITLMGFAYAPHYYWLLLLSIPLGLGGGAVDTGLNNYVAVHYTSKHMSWLHCFWGVGAFIGPLLMNHAILKQGNWQLGYRTVSWIQLGIALILLLSLPLWMKSKASSTETQPGSTAPKSSLRLLQQKGVLLSILIFPLYIGVEAGVGLWLGSYLVEGRQITQSVAGLMISAFYASITVGRFFNGFLSEHFSNKNLIRLGSGIILLGCILLPIPTPILLYPSIILLGLGCAPIFPCLIHETPRRFGTEHSEIITGYQIGASYLSGLLIIPIIGLLASGISIIMIPISITFFGIIVLLSTEILNKKMIE